MSMKNKNWLEFDILFFDFCDLIIANVFNSQLIFEPTSQDIIDRAGFIENFADNENIEFGFETIFSKNVTHWDFDRYEKISRLKKYVER